jgi:hypothetical protein
VDDAGVAEAHVLEDPEEERAAHTVIGLGQIRVEQPGWETQLLQAGT